MFGLTLGSCCNGTGRELFFISRSYCSTPTDGRETSLGPSSFLPEFLADSLGFSRKESATIAAKVIRYSSRTKPSLVVDVLKEIGLDTSQIKKCVSRFPRLLYFDIDKTLSPKFEFLQELGFSSSDLTEIIVKAPEIFSGGLDTNIRLNVAALADIFGGNTEDLRRTIKSFPWLLHSGFVPKNISYFKELGFSIDQIRRFISIMSLPFCYPTRWFQERVDMLVNDFGLPRGSSKLFYAVRATSNLSKSKMERKLAIFRSFGWSESEIVTTFSTQPNYFALSEASIQRKLDYYMNKLGLKPAYMSAIPFLSYSLEKRVIPRIEVVTHTLKEKKRPSLYAIICLAESKFEAKYLLPYKDVMPDLYESYKSKVGR
ncbi:hypothetical protein DM860_017044 [Cuscuta australis]|uniref:Uncharacterized protein n=1 Tax=Cuscuta australis TaxID=267555 RepID=A0A328DSK6_9ASTE|nr:hypothetical protein DM860_017044 [Cuscuta australis]